MQLPISYDNTMRELFEYPDPSFPFVVWTGDFQTFGDHSIVCHWHHELEYGVLLSGELDYFIDGQHIRIRQGDAVFINADTMHMAKQVDECGQVVLFTVSFLPSLFTGGNDGTMFRKYFLPLLQSAVRGFSIEREAPDGNKIVELLKALHDLEIGQDEHYELDCLNVVSRLWSLTLRYIQAHGQDFPLSCKNRRNEEKAKDILAYLQEHYTENVCIETIARKTGISRSECFRCFQRYTGKNPIEYLTEYRLAHAANMLKKGEKSVTQIAVECGFSSASYFGKTFKKKYGITPSRFRQPAVEA